jgi:UDP-glucose 4-epimerase
VAERRAVVTGGAGFIGSHVVDDLLGDGWSVVVIDDLSTGRADRVAPEADLERIDISHAAAVDALMDAFGPTAIFHLAAQSSVTVSVTDPGRDCAVNVGGTLNVVEAAGRHGAPVVFSSTGGALYGDAAPLHTPEEHPPAPLAPYGASKWAGEAYVRTWALRHDLPHAVCRLGNVYGPRQSSEGEAGVVAIFSGRVSRGERPIVFGHGAPTRDYVHVDDVVRALRAASGRAGVFNVATGAETSVARVLELVASAAGVEVDPELQPLRPGELNRSCLDAGRAERELGWTPRIRVEEGIPATYRALVEELDSA